MDTMLESPLEPWDASHHGSSFGHDAMSMAPNQQAMPRPGSSQSAAGGVPGVPGGGISKQAAAGDSDLSLGRESGATLVGNQGTAGEFQGQRGRSSAQKETPVPSKVRLATLGWESGGHTAQCPRAACAGLQVLWRQYGLENCLTSFGSCGADKMDRPKNAGDGTVCYDMVKYAT